MLIVLSSSSPTRRTLSYLALSGQFNVYEDLIAEVGEDAAWWAEERYGVVRAHADIEATLAKVTSWDDFFGWQFYRMVKQVLDDLLEEYLQFLEDYPEACEEVEIGDPTLEDDWEGEQVEWWW